ncbi:protein CASC3 isoform X2 [Sardina pilchardus]|uniref:protein CASC3 isoform X2 n=1 Tax=Sardina pilchardus TaxID=27697 RepID=UPI002E145C52
MADRRRRRRRASQDSEEEDESASGSEGERPCSPGAKARVREPEPVESPSVRVVKKSDDESECESEDGAGEAVLSDYDSADPEEGAEEEGSHSEGGEEDEDEPEENASRPAEVPVAEPDGPVVELEVAEAEAEAEAEVEVKGVVVVEEEEEEVEGEEEEEEEEEEAESEAVEKEAKTEDKSNLAGERQSGDGQESTDDPENKGGIKTGQKLDDDEDRKNPAYIPRKGLFFEHDVRGQTQEEERPKGRHRKLWKDEGRWEHDRFREEEQAPKSREELVAYYGYDIRNGTGPSEGRQYRPRKPRHGSPPSRDKRYRDLPSEKFVPRSWQGARSAPPAPGPQSSGPPHGPSHPAPSGPRPSAPRLSSSHPAANHSGRGFQAGRPQQQQQQVGLHRGEGRGDRGPNGAGPRYQRPQHVEGERGPRLRGTRGPGPGHQSERSPSVVVEDVQQIGDVDDDDLDDEGPAITMTTTFTSSSYSHYSKAERDIAVAATAAATAPSLQFSRRQQQQQDPSPSSQQQQQQQQQQQRGTGGSGDFPASSAGRDSSPPPERPVERKSYSAARRTRVRPSDMGKQASLDEPVLPQTTAPPAGGGGGGGGSNSGGSGVGMKGDHWQGGQGESGPPGPLTGLDQDLARLSLAGQNWAQSPPSYLRTDLRGIPSSMHMGGAPPPPPYANMDEMGVGGGRAKRYSSQRQRPVPEPAPLHIGVMEGHYYEPMSYQGPIYAHGDSPAPIPPQGMLVQPEMHLPHPGHPGLHPHQSGGPMPNPALYAAPPVSMSPGQPPPQQLMAAPFYPPPGVMTFSNTNFPYSPGATLPPMYPNPQAQSQVYGGVTYYDTVQQQAQPKPSPPRRSSQPVTVKPPPPEYPSSL